jgi:drug/metabolite transporter (DMT)-like permease
MSDAMTPRGWWLFGAMSVIWGIPYLLIKVAVDHVAPVVVVFGRTSIASVVLLVVASRTGYVRAALREWRWVLAFGAIEMGVPWLALTNAEKQLPSGLTGLLVACVPLFSAVIGYLLGDHTALHRVRLVGIAVGLGGVALLVGGDLGGGKHGIPWWSVVQVMIVCVCYATGPFIVARRLADVPSLGVVSVSVTAVAIAAAPLAWLARPSTIPPANALLSILGLALICTALAFVLFFALIGEIGPTRSTLITFVNPAVAVLLGAIALGEAITLATIGGFVLVVTGCWLATRPQAPRRNPRRPRAGVADAGKSPYHDGAGPDDTAPGAASVGERGQTPGGQVSFSS